MLQNKNAVIYGAGGSLGSTVAKALAAAGARVFLTGRTLSALQKVADEIIATGGRAKVAQVDAFNETAIHDHLQQMVQQAGSVDISFNATASKVVQNIPLTSMSVEDFITPLTLMTQTRFLTAIAAGKIMMQQRSGVILSLTATPGGIGYPYTGGFAPACTAIETFAQNLGSELGVYGVRVVNIRSGGSPDSKVFKDAIEQMPHEMEQVLTKMKADTMLKKMPLMQDIANVAVFLCSEMAAGITGVTVDVTCGTTAGLNYRVDAEREEKDGKVLAG
jgi:NAD(P)-dependent dehydrogenase (short-subunit alcohol dehydrogenase family)